MLARLDSTRLPGKQLERVGTRNILGHVAAACRGSGVDDVVLATSVRNVDDLLVRAAQREGIHVYRGSIDDVAGRFLAAADMVGASVALRVNGDSPFVRAEMLRDAIAQWRRDPVDLVTNVPGRFWPAGLSVEAVSIAAMRRAVASNLSAAEREHVTKAFYDADPGTWTIRVLSPGPPSGRGLHLAVDTEEDLARARVLSERLGRLFDSASVAMLIDEARALERNK